MFGAFSWLNAIFTVVIAALLGYGIVWSIRREIHLAIDKKHADVIASMMGDLWKIEYMVRQVADLRMMQQEDRVRMEEMDRRMRRELDSHKRRAERV